MPTSGGRGRAMTDMERSLAVELDALRWVLSMIDAGDRATVEYRVERLTAQLGGNVAANKFDASRVLLCDECHRAIL